MDLTSPVCREQEFGKIWTRYPRLDRDSTGNLYKRIGYEAILPEIPEIDENVDGRVALIDWLNIGFQLDKSLDWFDSILRAYLGYGIKEKRLTGKYFYESSWILEDERTLFCCGGSSQRGTALLSIPGQALQFLDVNKILELGRDILNGWITRVDPCADFFHGEYTVDKAKDDYEKGLFNCGGRMPVAKWITPSDGSGRTQYVGKRGSEKLIRVYEKGRQLGITEGPYSNWTRTELELKGSRPGSKKGRIIPWEILTFPGKFLAGSCKAFGFLSVIQDKVKVVKVKAGASVTSSLKHARRMYGKNINACKHMGMSDKDIIEKIQREGFPKYYEPENNRKIDLTGDMILTWVKDIFNPDLEWQTSKGGAECARIN